MYMKRPNLLQFMSQDNQAMNPMMAGQAPMMNEMGGMQQQMMMQQPSMGMGQTMMGQNPMMFAHGGGLSPDGSHNQTMPDGSITRHNHRPEGYTPKAPDAADKRDMNTRGLTQPTRPTRPKSGPGVGSYQTRPNVEGKTDTPMQQQQFDPKAMSGYMMGQLKERGVDLSDPNATAKMLYDGANGLPPAQRDQFHKWLMDKNNDWRELK